MYVFLFKLSKNRDCALRGLIWGKCKQKPSVHGWRRIEILQQFSWVDAVLVLQCAIKNIHITHSIKCRFFYNRKQKNLMFYFIPHLINSTTVFHISWIIATVIIRLYAASYWVKCVGTTFEMPACGNLRSVTIASNFLTKNLFSPVNTEVHAWAFQY
jgi:hypothetical protein